MDGQTNKQSTNSHRETHGIRKHGRYVCTLTQTTTATSITIAATIVLLYAENGQDDTIVKRNKRSYGHDPYAIRKRDDARRTKNTMIRKEASVNRSASRRTQTYVRKLQ